MNVPFHIVEPALAYLRWLGGLFDPIKSWQDMETNAQKLHQFIDIIETGRRTDPELRQKLFRSTNYANLTAIQERDEFFWPAVRFRAVWTFEHNIQVSTTPSSSLVCESSSVSLSLSISVFSLYRIFE